MRYFVLALVLVAFGLIQVFIGGAKMLYSIPPFALVALASLTVLLPGWRPPKTVSVTCVAATLLWVGYLLIRNRLSPVEYLARPDFLILLGSLMMYLLTTVWLNETKHRGVLMAGLITLALVHVVLGSIQFRNGDQYMPIPWIKRMDTQWRASGFYICPNHFAGMLEVVGLFAISMVCWSRWKIWAKLILGYGAFACAAGVAISGSRGGYLSFVAGGIVLVILSLFVVRKVAPHRFWLGTILALVVFFAGLGGGLTLMFRSAVLKNRVAEINDPTNMRLYMWAAALKQHALNRTWGTGSGTYLFYGRHFRQASVQNDPIYVHNDYLHLLAEYGIVGSALFLVFFGAHAVNAFKAFGRLARRTQQNGQTQSNAMALNIGAISAVAAYVVHSVVDFNLHIPANALLMGVVFGIIANPGVQTSRSVTTLTAHFARWAIPLTAVGFLAFAPAKWTSEYYTERARMALRDKKWSEAQEFAQKALSTEWRNHDAFYYLGEATRLLALESEAKRDVLTKEAITTFEKGIEIFPQDVRIALKLALSYDTLGDFDSGAEWLDKAAELDPYLGMVYAYLGLHYHQQRMLAEAREQYEHALQLDPLNEIGLAGRKEVDDIVNRTRERARRAAMRGEELDEEEEEIKSMPARIEK